MNTERWNQVEAVYHAALEQDPAERKAFLDDNCPDGEVRREVESLLQHEETGERLLETSPRKPNLGQDEVTGPFHGSLASRTCLGRYEIVSPIGRGGVGEVYPALVDPLLSAKWRTTLASASKRRRCSLGSRQSA
jgi:serine/threonine-protein kinase